MRLFQFRLALVKFLVGQKEPMKIPKPVTNFHYLKPFDQELDMKKFPTYSFVPNFRRGVKLQILRKKTSVHLIIIREWPKNNPYPF